MSIPISGAAPLAGRASWSHTGVGSFPAVIRSESEGGEPR